MASDMRDAIAQNLERILEGVCTPATVRRVEEGEDPAAIWSELEASGFIDALVAETAGGAGLSLPDIFPIPELCGRFAVPVPLAETMMLRGLMAAAGAQAPAGMMTMGRGTLNADGGLRCGMITLGRVAEHVVVDTPDGALVLAAADASLEATGFALDAAMSWPATAVTAAPRCPLGVAVDVVLSFVYAIQLSGAMLTVFRRSLDYANDRQQFGRPIGKFQAIQHQLSQMAEHVFAARMTAELAATGVLRPDPARVAVAKARTSEAAVAVAAMAHGIHGAIGFTEEFDLQLFTRRLNCWRRAGGSESYWQDWLGRALIEDRRPKSLDMLRELTAVV